MFAGFSSLSSHTVTGSVFPPAVTFPPQLGETLDELLELALHEELTELEEEP